MFSIQGRCRSGRQVDDAPGFQVSMSADVQVVPVANTLQTELANLASSSALATHLRRRRSRREEHARGWPLVAVHGSSVQVGLGQDFGRLLSGGRLVL